ncbi:MAG: tetratricopeptide repeat protein [Alphaproteobacteria bacterium]|nr:tetratricopeptide repeat protein [Alphaproteobacteria bacterium]
MSFYLLQKALAAHQNGNLTQAETGYREILAAQPDHIDALSLLGTLLSSRGAHDEALRLVSRAVELDPQAVLLWLNLGNVHMAREDYDQAAACFAEAVRLEPNQPEAPYDLGNALRSSGKWDEAEAAYHEVLRRAPNHVLARNNLALVYEHQEKYSEAISELQKALEVEPHFGEAWLNLCKIAESAGDYPLGLDAGMKSTALMPQNSRAWLGLGVILNRLERDEEALQAYHTALKLNPQWPEVWDNLGQTYQFLGRLEEAEKAFLATVEADGQVIKDEAVRRVNEREYGNRHWHLALLELLKGDLASGFARYRARFQDVGGLVRPAYPVPVWQGEDLTGKTILVMDEQGQGDCMMLLRYLPLLKARGARVWLLVHPALISLLTGWACVDKLIPRGQSVRDFDFYASIFDLPYGFGTTLETIPAQIPYLPIPAVCEALKLDLQPSKKHIAVVWGGAPKHKQDSKRSIPLAVLSSLFDVAGVQFFSLNRDKREGDDALLATLPVVDLAPRLNDFSDAAQFMAQMDLVITCDTATAHMAGGMGKDVWTLLPFAPDWRWLMDREDTPWYPTMRLFRQALRGDWAEVIGRVRRELEKKVG